MPRKISHSDISLYIMPVYNSVIKKCKVCSESITNHQKMVVFNELYLPIGFSCRHCNSVYEENDVLIDIGNPDKVDIYGES